MAKRRVRLPVDVRREQVIDLALTLITEVGYHRFTLAELARRCGMTRQGLLHYFPSREHALLAALEERDRREAASNMPEEGFAGTPAQVRRLFDGMIARTVAQPEMARLHVLLTAEALDDDHPAHAYFLQRLRTIQAALGPLLDSETRNGADAVVEVFAFMDGIQLAWLRDPDTDLVARWKSFADAYFAGE